MNYSYQDLTQGNKLKSQAEESPSTFGTNEGALTRNESPSFGTSRMAGGVGARALQLMGDPQEAQRTQNWMRSFGMTNEGMQFNQAKMMMAAPPQAAPKEEQK